MKIADLKIHVLKSTLAEPFAFSQGWVDIPSGSGLGVEIERAVLERCRA